MQIAKPNTLVAVSLGIADACGIGGRIAKLGRASKQNTSDEFRTLAESPAIPQLAWAVSKYLSKERIHLIRETLTSLINSSEGKAILQHANLTGVVSANHEDYPSLQIYLD